MDCPGCAGELVSGAAFCGHCGTPIDPLTAAVDDAESLADPVEAGLEPAPPPPPPPPPPPDHGPEVPAAPSERSDTSSSRPRRLRYLVAVAALVALIGGIVLTQSGPDGDNQVAATDTTTTTTRSGTTRDTREGGDRGAEAASTTEDTVPTASVPDTTVASAPKSTNNGSGSNSDSGSLSGAPAPTSPSPEGPPPPAPPPPAPPPTSPPGPAALVVVTDCINRCEIERGGRVELRIINFGGRTGRFTIDVSEGIDPRPRRSALDGGQTQTVQLVETAGKRRAYRVDVLDGDGNLVFRTSVSVN